MSSVIHSPIFPKGDDEVKFYISDISDLSEVTLLHSVYKIQADGNRKLVKPESILKKWEGPFDQSYLEYQAPHYGNSKFVNYIFSVKTNNGNTYVHRVGFATSPYVLKGHPIPVYVVGDINKASNCIFICDDDDKISDGMFYDQVAKMISDAMHIEPTLKLFRNLFNYFIHPQRSKVEGYEGNGFLKSIPLYRNISFANVKVILHNKNIRNYYDLSTRICGVKFNETILFLHETAHGLFELEDEYKPVNQQSESGSGDYNVWMNEEKAKDMAVLYNSNAIRITEYRYKICNDSCIMNDVYVQNNEKLYFNLRCRDVVYNVLNNRARKINSRVPEYREKRFVRDYDIEELNLFMSNYLFDAAYIGDLENKHVSFILKNISNKLFVDDDSFDLRPGTSPYVSNNSLVSILFFSSDGICLYEYQWNRAVNIDVNQEVEILLPYDRRIRKFAFKSKIEFEKNNLVSDEFIEINSKAYDMLFIH